MKAFARLFESLFDKNATSDSQKIYKEWDRQRARAMSPNEISEIDAIFARHLGS